MAKCDQGYLCRVCGEEVEGIIESELYLQYVIGWVDPEQLHLAPECHLRCNPVLAQFIEDERFQPPVVVEGPCGLASLDVSFVEDRKQLIQRGYARLWEIFNLEDGISVTDYPLPEAIERYRN